MGDEFPHNQKNLFKHPLLAKITEKIFTILIITIFVLVLLINSQFSKFHKYFYKKSL